MSPSAGMSCAGTSPASADGTWCRRGTVLAGADGLWKGTALGDGSTIDRGSMTDVGASGRLAESWLSTAPATPRSAAATALHRTFAPNIASRLMQTPCDAEAQCSYPGKGMQLAFLQEQARLSEK